jgi:hypothetical protein
MRRAAVVAVTFAAVVAATVVAQPARAEVHCAAPAGASEAVAAIDGRERLRWIADHLDHEAHRGRVWAYGWGIGIGAAGVGSLAAVPFVAAGDRIDWYTSAATAAVGVLPFVISPLKVTRDAPHLRADIDAAGPSPDDAHVCALLASAEHKLADDAADEQWQQGWWIHAGNLAFNTGVLLFLGLGYHHWSSGLINGLSGAAVGETIILTQPTRIIDDAQAYERGELAHSVSWSYRLRF